MKHFATPDFWLCYRSLPEAEQRLADKNFLLLQSNVDHPSLRLKRIGIYWSARVGRNYRVLGKTRPEGIVWIWIGPHDEYEQLLK